MRSISSHKSTLSVCVIFVKGEYIPSPRLPCTLMVYAKELHGAVLGTVAHSEDACFDWIETGEQLCHLDFTSSTV